MTAKPHLMASSPKRPSTTIDYAGCVSKSDLKALANHSLSAPQARYLAHALAVTAEFGKGFDASNLRYMRLFYHAFPKCDALRHELSWTHIGDWPNSACRPVIQAVEALSVSPPVEFGRIGANAAMGGYGGQTAIAVGVHHVTRRNLAISGGVAASTSGGKLAYRLGGSFKF